MLQEQDKERPCLMPMRHIGYTYLLNTKHKNGKPKKEVFTSKSTTLKKFFIRKGKKVEAIKTGMVYLPVAK